MFQTMRKKNLGFCGIIFAVIVAIGFVSCSDDTTSDFDPAGTVSEFPFIVLQLQYNPLYTITHKACRKSRLRCLFRKRS